MDDAVDHRGGDCLVAEHAGPAGERQVAGEHERGVFVAGADELEEQVRGVLFEGQVADLVDLCGHPHRSTYADTATMPSSPLRWLRLPRCCRVIREADLADLGIVAGPREASSLGARAPARRRVRWERRGESPARWVRRSRVTGRGWRSVATRRQTVRNMLKYLGQVGSVAAGRAAGGQRPGRAADGGVPCRPAGRWQTAASSGPRAMAPLLTYLRERARRRRCCRRWRRWMFCSGSTASWMLSERGLADEHDAALREHRPTFPARAGRPRWRADAGDVDRRGRQRVPAT